MGRGSCGAGGGYRGGPDCGPARPLRRSGPTPTSAWPSSTSFTTGRWCGWPRCWYPTSLPRNASCRTRSPPCIRPGRAIGTGQDAGAALCLLRRLVVDRSRAVPPGRQPGFRFRVTAPVGQTRLRPALAPEPGHRSPPGSARSWCRCDALRRPPPEITGSAAATGLTRAHHACPRSGRAGVLGACERSCPPGRLPPAPPEPRPPAAVPRLAERRAGRTRPRRLGAPAWSAAATMARPRRSGMARSVYRTAAPNRTPVSPHAGRAMTRHLATIEVSLDALKKSAKSSAGPSTTPTWRPSRGLCRYHERHGAAVAPCGP